MRTLSLRAIPLAFCLLAAGCASRPLPTYEKPIARTQFQHVRTTAYTDTESDHVQYTNHNALGTCLQCGPINSAAADWSRWPAGTMFRVVETGEIYQVDDYGWALAGTNTIDLYKPSRSAMNTWGVRHVTIENLQWGDPHRSLAVLRPRARYRHIERMVGELHERMAELSKPVPTSLPPPTLSPLPPAAPSVITMPAGQPVSPPPMKSYQTASSAPPATQQAPTSRFSNTVARDPFYSNTAR